MHITVTLNSVVSVVCVPSLVIILPLGVVHATCHLLMFPLYPYDLCVRFIYS